MGLNILQGAQDVPTTTLLRWLSFSGFHRSSLWILGVAIAGLLLVWFGMQRSRQKLKVQVVLADEIYSSKQRSMEYFYRPREVMLKGYAKFREQVYGIDTRDGVKVVVPPHLLDDLKSHPHLSFKASIDNVGRNPTNSLSMLIPGDFKDMLKEYTFFGGPPECVIHAIKGSMTSSLPAYTPLFHRMVRESLPTELPATQEWLPVKVYDKILKIVGTNNARVFQSTAASEDDQWVAASTGYVLSTFDCIRALKAWPPYLRPFVYRFIPERSAIKEQWIIARKRVAESIKERQQKGSNLEDPPSMLDHLSSGKNEHLATNVDEQLLYQMTLVAVGTVTTFASITQALYDLAAFPHYASVLREELSTIVKNDDGDYTRESIMAMKKLDSFIKESQRLSAPDLTTFQRAATADLTLPDGTFIPRGTKLEANTCSIHVDGRYYQNPNDFDGLRYYRMRQVPGEENKHMYYSVGKNDLSFGYGRHACPGRYLGHLNIKLVLAEILDKYDLKLKPGQSRPKNQEFEAIVSPDPDFEVLLRRRQHDRV